MKMESRIAIANMKYYRKRNIMIGIAVFFATLLLFVIPGFSYNGIQLQFKAVNKIYPTWHGMYRSVPEDDIPKIASYHLVSRYGLRCDTGFMREGNVKTLYTYLDKSGLELSRCELESGHWPEAENEIVTSRQALKYYHASGEIGDTVTLPYQVYEGNGLSVKREKDFVISGLVADVEQEKDNIQYTVFVSEGFVKNELKKEDRLYRFLLQVEAKQSEYYKVMETRVKETAAVFGIDERTIAINDNYLHANYVDEANIPVVVGILAIIVFAGVITIYSIYYVGLPERMREFGRLKALGTTKRQLRNIMLREGLYVAAAGMIAALIVGTFLLGIGTRLFYAGLTPDNPMAEVSKEIIKNHEIGLLHLWNYLLAGGVSLLTVYISMQKVLRKVSHVSEIEAIRYQSNTANRKHQKKFRNSYFDISIPKLALIHFKSQRKEVSMTVCAMSITGILIMVVATVLSCADPKEAANASIYGRYNLNLEYEYENKEHPEREWNQVIADNPITDDLLARVKAIDGIEDVITCSELPIRMEAYETSMFGIRGLPKDCMEKLMDSIVEGSVTYEEMKEGKKVVLDQSYCKYYHFKVGDHLKVQLQDKQHTMSDIEIAAVAKVEQELPAGEFYMANEGCRKLMDGNLSGNVYIFAEKKYDKRIEDTLNQIVKENKDTLRLSTWQHEYDTWAETIMITRAAAYAFLAVLSVISIMTMINTMVHSVHIRKRDFGMMQAIGMSEGQLRNMLGIESLLYAAGSIILSIGIGSIAGYPVFLWAKGNGIFNVSKYFYPMKAACIVAAVILLIQLFITLRLSKGVKKESVIERIRYTE